MECLPASSRAPDEGLAPLLEPDAFQTAVGLVVIVAVVGTVVSAVVLWRCTRPEPRRARTTEPSIRNSPILHPVVLAYSHGTSTIPLIGQTIGENLRETARRFPERDALVVPFQRVRLTYADFDSTVDTLALSLLGAGIAKGDRVGVWSPNNAEWVVIQYAAARAGAILVNLNPAYRTHEIEYALRQSECRLLFAATSYKTSDYVAMIDAVRSNVPTLERVVFLGTESWKESARCRSPGRSIGAARA